jgi:sortase A
LGRKGTFEPVYSLTFVCLVAGLITAGIALLTNGFLLSAETSATSPQSLRAPLIPDSDPSDQAVPETVSQQNETEADPDTDSDPDAIMPSTLRIPSISVDADVEHVGYTDDGRMDSPVEWENVAWFKYGFFPGAAGNSVIAGHLDSDTGPAIFANLHQMQPGDEIFVTGADGSELTFVVTDVQSVDADEAPLDRIFGESDEQHLNLITCEGHFDPNAEDYDHRLIVYSTLAES